MKRQSRISWPILLFSLVSVLVVGGCPGGETPDPGCEGDAAFDPGYALVSSGSYIQDKNDYLLTLFQQVPSVLRSLEEDPWIRSFGEEWEDRLRDAVETCPPDIECYADALLFEQQEAEEIGDALLDLFGAGQPSCVLIEHHMRPSGMFQMYAESSDEEMLWNAWMDTVAGLRTIFDSHARALDPHRLDQIIRHVSETNVGPLLFFEPLLHVAMAVLEERGRDEAGRYEPLMLGENRLAAERVPRIRWDDFPYPAMLVPGQGPNVEWIALSSLGKYRCRIVAERFEAGQAPFIVVSGGHVHPDQTPYSEAIEMKRYLMERLGVPEDAIIVDPHARHTPTNLRNFARICFRYGIPTDRYSLITTDMFQAIYIAYMLDDRCLEELGYMPYQEVRRVSPFDSLLMPNITSLYADPRDPLDP